jgi:hypothetical protein
MSRCSSQAVYVCVNVCAMCGSQAESRGPEILTIYSTYFNIASKGEETEDMILRTESLLSITVDPRSVI